MIYNKDRFVLMDSDTFWLSSTPDIVSEASGASGVRICTWAELFDKYTGETIIMANTHLDHKSTNVRVAQAQFIRRHLRKRLAERFDECRLYLTGDFTCIVDSSPYDMIT